MTYIKNSKGVVLGVGDFVESATEYIDGRIIISKAIAGACTIVAGVPPIVSVPLTRAELKMDRQIKVDAILVTTTAGNVFNGDEKSQDRMARAIIALNAQPQSPVPTIKWTLANNISTPVTAAELIEALSMAGAAQSAIWII